MKVIGNKERKLYIASLVLFAMTPVVAGLLRLLFDGHGIADIWPIDSLWNDEAMKKSPSIFLTQAGKLFLKIINIFCFHIRFEKNEIML
ncbi:MAG: hypothetical protein K5796_10910 [Lachnospiraceae bacterium]|nr:hypothetical protein [Lachnospiraceae bacterium]